MNPDIDYVVAGVKPWNRRIFDYRISDYPGRWHFAAAPDQLINEVLSHISPRYIFFLHWCWKVPVDIIERYECICFHMTDVPYGRGGSPLQNLIIRGHRLTRLTALRMVHDMDAGPVYLKRDLSLEGSAEEIYIRASALSAEMIRYVIEKEPEACPQQGEPVCFSRRRPAESRIPDLPTISELHDFIRMLDADGYPRAFIEHKGYRYTFDRAVLYDGRIRADVTIIPVGGSMP